MLQSPAYPQPAVRRTLATRHTVWIVPESLGWASVLVSGRPALRPRFRRRPASTSSCCSWPAAAWPPG